MTYLFVVAIILIVIAIIYYYQPKSNNSDHTSTPPTSQNQNPFEQLRQLALDVTSEKLGIAPTDDTPVYGIVMDWHLGNGIATVSAFNSGDASMYLSTGGGVIGGGQHENVREAVFEFIKTGQGYLTRAVSTNETPLPKDNMVNFYFLTDQGKYLGSESMSNIENGTSGWLPLFEEANNVITELRLTAENK